MKKQILSVLVENNAGVLSQVSRLFARKAYSIDSLTVGPTEDHRISRMTIIVTYDDEATLQIANQVSKLTNVVSVEILPAGSISRELLMIKVRATDRQSRDEIIQLANIFRGRIVDVARETLTVEITGDTEKNAALVGLLHDYGIDELARSGAVALRRGEQDAQQ